MAYSSRRLAFAAEDFYSVLLPHVVEDGREYANHAVRTGDTSVNRDWA